MKKTIIQSLPAVNQLDSLLMILLYEKFQGPKEAKKREK
jgi:hypothetical protein